MRSPDFITCRMTFSNLGTAPAGLGMSRCIVDVRENVRGGELIIERRKIGADIPRIKQLRGSCRGDVVQPCGGNAGHGSATVTRIFSFRATGLPKQRANATKEPALSRRSRRSGGRRFRLGCIDVGS